MKGRHHTPTKQPIPSASVIFQLCSLPTKVVAHTCDEERDTHAHAELRSFGMVQSTRQHQGGLPKFGLICGKECHERRHHCNICARLFIQLHTEDEIETY